MQRKLVIPWCLLILTWVSAGAAEESLDEWVQGPEAFLLTDGERGQLADLSGSEAQREFFDLFWARRDPDLSTRDNEFRYGIEQRIIAADAEFAEEGTRGALTPRGRVLILLGVPDRHGKMEIAEYLSGLYQIRPPAVTSLEPNAQATMSGVSFNRAKGMADVWAYRRESLPPGIELDDEVEEVTFAFFDIDGDGHFILQRNIRRAQAAEQVLAAAPAALVQHPELDRLPEYSLLVGFAPATAEQLAVFDSETLPWPDGAAGMAVQGVAAAGSYPTWVSLELPSSAAPADTLVGRIRREDGSVIGSFVQKVAPRSGAHGVSYETALPIPPGTCVADLALLAGAETVAAQQLNLVVDEPAEVFISPVTAGAEVSQSTESAAGDPFVFGGYHLVPRPDGDYAAGENLAIFCLVAVPGSEAESLEAKVRMRWYVNGKSTPSAPANPVRMAAAAPGVYVWGTQLPLDSLAVGTSYSLKITLTETSSEVSRTTEIPISRY